MYSLFKALKDFAEFAGRARRRGFWMFTLLNSATTSGLAVARGGDAEHLPASVIATVYACVILIPTLAIGARRPHAGER